MSDLKRELTRFRETEAHSAKYIVDLEARLARSDESVLGLQQTVEKLEKDCERRQSEIAVLQSRLGALRQDGDSWRTDLEGREKKVRELEEKMQEWEKKKTEAGEARNRLGSVVGEVASARRSLEINLANVNVSAPSTAEPSPVTEGRRISIAEEIAPTSRSPSLESQLVALQQTHTATLADLSSITSKYRDALREISDLAAQIQEAKLSNISESNIDELYTPEKPPDIPPFRRRLGSARMREATEPQLNPAGRRLFFRQAASTESLHSR